MSYQDTVNEKWYCAVDITTQSPIAKSLSEPNLVAYIVSLQTNGQFPCVTIGRIKDETFPNLQVIE